MSQHQIEIISVKMEPHPNADKLAIVRPFGYTVCVNKNDWKDGDLAAYIPPDYVVDIERPEFSFLERPRIKVKKLRGIMSQGLLVPAPINSKLGDNVIDILGIHRYNPEDPINTRGDAIRGPDLISPKYDVDDYRRYGQTLFSDTDQIVVTEKIHGSNARFVMTSDGKIWCGSRAEWKKEDANNLWWKCLQKNPKLSELLKKFPNYVFYGEVFGHQDLKYDANGQTLFRLFDTWDGQNWMEFDWLATNCSELLVPILYKGLHSSKIIEGLAEGKSTLANHIREGCVIRSIPERNHPRLGRAQLKLVSNSYLEKS